MEVVLCSAIKKKKTEAMTTCRLLLFEEFQIFALELGLEEGLEFELGLEPGLGLELGLWFKLGQGIGSKWFG